MIGINEQIASSSGSNSGVGFAIPVTSVRYSLDQLRANGKVEYAFLGVTSESLYPQLAEHLGLDVKSGALITDVVSGSPADKAGLKGSTGETTFQLQHVKTGGDVVIAVDGKPVFQNNDLSELVAAPQARRHGHARHPARRAARAPSTSRSARARLTSSSSQAAALLERRP